MIPAPPCPHRTMAGHRQLSTPLPWNSPLVIFPTPTRTRFRQRPPKCPTSRWTIPHSKATTSTIIKMQVNMNLIKGTRDFQERLTAKTHTSNMIRATIMKSSINNTPTPHIMPLTTRRLPLTECLCNLNTLSTINPPLKVRPTLCVTTKADSLFEGYLDLGSQMFDEHSDCFNGHNVAHYQ